MKAVRKTTQWIELLVFTLFALCILQVLLSGAQTYRRLIDEGEAHYDARTAVQYIATRVRQAQSVSIGEFGDGQALLLGETVDGVDCVTHVYLSDGCLRELFCLRGAALPPSVGEKLLPADQLTLELAGDCLRVEINGRTLILHIPTGKEVPS